MKDSRFLQQRQPHWCYILRTRLLIYISRSTRYAIVRRLRSCPLRRRWRNFTIFWRRSTWLLCMGLFLRQLSIDWSISDRSRNRPIRRLISSRMRVGSVYQRRTPSFSSSWNSVGRWIAPWFSCIWCVLWETFLGGSASNCTAKNIELSLYFKNIIQNGKEHNTEHMVMNFFKFIYI